MRKVTSTPLLILKNHSAIILNQHLEKEPRKYLPVTITSSTNTKQQEQRKVCCLATTQVKETAFKVNDFIKPPNLRQIINTNPLLPIAMCHAYAPYWSLESLEGNGIHISLFSIPCTKFLASGSHLLFSLSYHLSPPPYFFTCGNIYINDITDLR